MERNISVIYLYRHAELYLYKLQPRGKPNLYYRFFNFQVPTKVLKIPYVLLWINIPFVPFAKVNWEICAGKLSEKQLFKIFKIFAKI